MRLRRLVSTGGFVGLRRPGVGRRVPSLPARGLPVLLGLWTALLAVRLLVRRLLVRRLVVLLRIRQRIVRRSVLHRCVRLLLGELAGLGITAVSDFAEAHVRRLAYGLVVDLEVRRLPELEHARDDVGRHRLHLGVVDPHVGVVVPPTSGDPVLGLGKLALQFEEVLVALQVRIRLDADDQVVHGAGESLFDIRPLLTRQRPLALRHLLGLVAEAGDVFQRVAFVRRIPAYGFHQVGNQLVAPIQLDVDLPPRFLDQVSRFDEAVVRTHRHQGDDHDDHQQDDDHGDGGTHEVSSELGSGRVQRNALPRRATEAIRDVEPGRCTLSPLDRARSGAAGLKVALKKKGRSSRRRRRRRRGEVEVSQGAGGWPSPSSEALMANRYGKPAASTRSRAPVSRSTITATPITSAPAWRSASTAVKTEFPVVLVSSTATTGRPNTSGPSIRRCSPWAFSDFRTIKESSRSPAAAAACNMAPATGSAPRVNPPTASNSQSATRSRITRPMIGAAWPSKVTRRRST